MATSSPASNVRNPRTGQPTLRADFHFIMNIEKMSASETEELPLLDSTEEVSLPPSKPKIVPNKSLNLKFGSTTSTTATSKPKLNKPNKRLDGSDGDYVPATSSSRLKTEGGNLSAPPTGINRGSPPSAKDDDSITQNDTETRSAVSDSTNSRSVRRSRTQGSSTPDDDSEITDASAPGNPPMTPWDKFHEAYVIKLYDTYGLDTKSRPVYVRKFRTDDITLEMSEMMFKIPEEPPLKRRMFDTMDLDIPGSIKAASDDLNGNSTTISSADPPKTVHDITSACFAPSRSRVSFKIPVPSNVTSTTSLVSVTKQSKDPRNDRYIATNTPFQELPAPPSSTSKGTQKQVSRRLGTLRAHSSMYNVDADDRPSVKTVSISAPVSSNKALPTSDALPSNRPVRNPTQDDNDCDFTKSEVTQPITDSQATTTYKKQKSPIYSKTFSSTVLETHATSFRSDPSHSRADVVLINSDGEKDERPTTKKYRCGNKTKGKQPVGTHKEAMHIKDEDVHEIDDVEMGPQRSPPSGSKRKPERMPTMEETTDATSYADDITVERQQKSQKTSVQHASARNPSRTQLVDPGIENVDENDTSIKTFTSDIGRNTTQQQQNATADCPVCGESIPLQTAERHVEDCLSNQFIKEDRQKQRSLRSKQTGGIKRTNDEAFHGQFNYATKGRSVDGVDENGHDSYDPKKSDDANCIRDDDGLEGAKNTHNSSETLMNPQNDHLSTPLNITLLKDMPEDIRRMYMEGVNGGNAKSNSKARRGGKGKDRAGRDVGDRPSTDSRGGDDGQCNNGKGAATGAQRIPNEAAAQDRPRPLKRHSPHYDHYANLNSNQPDFDEVGIRIESATGVQGF
ncbi:hypothetical protein SeLEV6574_g04845 [Synchytrium endobioticum]|uniref:UBZ4-type domain-containing protein n=1 Tax=Synchytrium endobioticum TaxID=286115 RepID=A0A507CXF1_9FUNG|nr:hypothetical protein SeLEV6574_g04845 [Synchytrium endobioticum]